MRRKIRFDWKEYLLLRPNLKKNWNGPVRAFLHFLVFSRIDHVKNVLKQQLWKFKTKFFLYNPLVSYGIYQPKYLLVFKQELWNFFRKENHLVSQKVLSNKHFSPKKYYGDSSKVPAKIFSFQKDEELLEKWIKHHAEMFGMKNIYIIDHGSGFNTKKIYDYYVPLGLNVFAFKGKFKEKKYCLSLIMHKNRKDADFLIPLDGDEFIFFNENSKPSFKSKDIFDYLYSVRNMKGKFKMVSYANLLESFETSDVFSECKYFKKEKTIFQRQKTYYPAKYFINTDQGNHHGLVSRDNDRLIASKLALLHYSHKGYSRYVQKLKRGVAAYGGKQGWSDGTGWFKDYDMYKNGTLEEWFLKNRFVNTVNKKSEDVIFFDTNAQNTKSRTTA